LLGGLRDGINAFAVALQGDEARRRGEIPVPDVVLDGLEMPDSLARVGVEREERVGEQVVPGPVRPVKIGRRRSGGNVHDPSLLVHRHARPVVRGTRVFPGVFRPGVIAVFAGVRDRVKRPSNLARPNVEGAEVSGRSGQGFRRSPSDDQEVFVKNAGAGQHDGLLLGIAAQPFAEVNSSFFPELRKGLARVRVQGVNVALDVGEKTALFAR
jgi:hypothetical protein